MKLALWKLWSVSIYVTNIILNYCLQYLNSNPSIYNAIIRAEKNPHLLTEEALRAARHLRTDLEKGGIHLNPGKEPLQVAC